MSDSETVLSLITDAASGVPEPVKKSFYKVFSDLLGALAEIPTAKLKQYTKSIEETTATRSEIAGILRQAAVDEVSRDPDLAKIAADVYFPSTIRKAKNRLRVAQAAAEHLGSASIEDGGEKTAPPDDDWMNNFMRFAEDASSDRLQDLFGRILTGQILRPGAFGLATLRIVSELDQELANDFTHAWTLSVGEAVDYSPDWQRGDGFSRWKRLVEAGLMASSDTRQYLPPFRPFTNNSAIWAPISVDGLSLMVYFIDGSSSSWDHINFTRVGREIGLLLPKPDYKKNIVNAGLRLSKHGVTKIDLVSSQGAEVVWRGV